METRNLTLRSLGTAAGWLIVAALLSLTLFVKTDRIDLELIVRAANHLWAGEPMYDLRDTLEHTKAPFITLYFVPLAKLGLWTAGRIFDLLNLIAYPVLVWFLLEKMGLPERGHRRTLFLLILLLTLNPWNTEVWTGQVNVLLWILILAAASNVPAPLAGFALMFALGMKPPHLLLLPWVLRHAPSPKKLLLWTGVATAASLLLYAACFGWPALWADHLAWAKFLPLSSQKHLANHRNYGLPSLLHQVPGISAACLLAGALLCEWICRTVPDRWIALSLISPLIVIFSPMAWFQNYTLAAGFVALVLNDLSCGPRSVRKAWLLLAVVALALAFPFHNPETIRHSALGRWIYGGNRIPFWGTAAAMLFWGAYRLRRPSRSFEVGLPLAQA